ncbi:MAG: STAS domain-containing protein [Candidatus Woesearchaeota archaeon]
MLDPQKQQKPPYAWKEVPGTGIQRLELEWLRSSALSDSHTFDEAHLAIIRDEVAGRLEDQTTRGVAIDFSQTEGGLTSLLSVLESLNRKAAANQKTLALIGVDPQTIKLMEVLQVYHIFHIYSNVGEVKKAYHRTKH